MRDGKRIAKVVAFFLLDYVSGDLGRPRSRGREGPLDEPGAGRAALTYKGEREMAERALSRTSGAR